MIDDKSKLRICIYNFVFVLKSILRYWTFYFLRKLFFIACKLFVVQINFGFCKGDDNFGGQRRKELDDFTKSLGKQMNLVMMRMEETKRIRTKIRQRNLMEEEEQFRRF